MLRITFTPRPKVRKNGGELLFKNLIGKAEVWQGATFTREKESFDREAFSVSLPPGDGERTISVQIEGETGKPVGLAGAVLVNGKPSP